MSAARAAIVLAALILGTAPLCAQPPQKNQAPAQVPAPGLGGSSGVDNDRPIHIEAEQGIEWQQSNHVYIARGHASATRGQSTVTADTLVAYYRPVAGANQGAAQSAKPAASDAKPAAGTSSLMGGGAATEIYRLEAEGNVHFTGPTQTATGDHAIYDVDNALLVLTGKNLKIETTGEWVTARDSIEWYDKKQIAVARGNALAVRGERRMRADLLSAEVEKPADAPARIHRINGYGNVIVAAADQIAHGDEGVYNLDTGIATMTGHVSVTKGDNELRGQYAVVDTQNNVSRVLAAAPEATASAGTKTRVEGLLVPSQRLGPAAGRPGQ
ncbi:MAG TPA: LptA/OstA family protein [Stellaceae bacterium]|nr:LptA/OstA family protein [Stellaceae bacterium]